MRSGLRRDLVGNPAAEDDFHQDLLPQSTMPKTTPTTAATTPIATPIFAPVLNPLPPILVPVLSEGGRVDVAVGSNVGEEVANTELVLSSDWVTVMIAYDVDEGDFMPPLEISVVKALVPAESAEVSLQSPLPLESV